jgi:hypothetical protein
LESIARTAREDPPIEPIVSALRDVRRRMFEC